MKNRLLWAFTIVVVFMLMAVSVNAEMVWPEYTSGYNIFEVECGATTNSTGRRIYNTGGLFTKARAQSETTVDEAVDITTEMNSIYASARIRNFNSGDNVYAFSQEINSGTRTCDATTERITEKYATYLQHQWRLYLNNEQELRDIYTISTYESGYEK